MKNQCLHGPNWDIRFYFVKIWFIFFKQHINPNFFLKSPIFSFEAQNFILCQQLFLELMEYIVNEKASKKKADAYGLYLQNRTLIIQKVSGCFIQLDYHKKIYILFHFKLEGEKNADWSALIKALYDKQFSASIPNARLNAEELTGIYFTD